MMVFQCKKAMRPLALVTILSACGSGGGGGIASAPPALPSPELLPDRPQKYATFAVSATEERSADGSVVNSSLGAARVQFRNLGDQRGYQIELPGMPSGNLTFSYQTNGSDRYTVTDATGKSLDTAVFLHSQVEPTTYSYTDLAFWISGATDPQQQKTVAGFLVYGVPTKPADVPRTGGGQYEAQVFGKTSLHGDVGGNAFLEFNFKDGALTGYMDPVLLNKTGFGDDVPLGRYVFADTMHAAGSTEFSGRFLVAGSTDPSSFSGLFTGPGAAELMAQWSAPFSSPESGAWQMMHGVWIGKKTD